MKKRFLLLSIALLAAVASAFADVTYYLQEGFESGIPSSWSQQTSVTDAAWATESLATRPSLTGLSALSAAPQGSSYAFERCANGGRYATVKLITPVMNFTGADVYQPTLSFKYAQLTRASYTDTLKVYYRLSATGEWTLLQTFGAATTDWTSAEVTLSNTNYQAYYQLAFEIKEADGLGVYLDDVRVMNASQCQDPSGITAVSGAQVVDISWTGDFTTASWRIAVFDHAVSMDTANVANAVFYNGNYVITDNTAISITSGLQPTTDYYVYISGTCDDNESGFTAWTSATFRTRTLINTFPYAQDFTGVSSGAIAEGWSRGHSSDLGSNVPGVLTNNTNYSLDASNCLFFGANTSSTTVKSATLAAGQYVYAVTPEIQGTAINQLAISFWGTAYSFFTPGVYAPQMEVGVLSDPDDLNTFTAVETVSLQTAYQHKKFNVSLASYSGAGKFIAFVVRGAALQNVFAIDNVVIDVETVPVPKNLKVAAITPNSLTLSADKNGAASWNAQISASYVHDSVPAALLSQSGVTGASVTFALPDSLAGKIVTVYAQGVKNGQAGAWSFPLTVRVPAKTATSLPFTQDFTSADLLVSSLQNEMKTNVKTKAPSCTYFAPTDLSYVPTISSSKLNLPYEGNYFALGYIDTLSTKEVVFYLQSGGTSTQSKLALGVMTNPYDLSTFTELAQFEGALSATEYTKCVYDLDQYTGAGHYLAFKSLSAANKIQKIEFTTIPTCRDALAVSAVAGSTKATFSWGANNMSKWQVILADSKTYANVLVDTIVTAPSCEILGLTPQTTYYYKVNTICGTDTVEMYGAPSITTALGIPYDIAFASSAPTGWKQYTGLLSDVFNGTALASASSGWSFTSSGVSGYVTPDGYAARFEIWSTGKKNWLVTPNISLAENVGQSIRLTFDAALPPYSSTYAADRNDGDDDKFAVVISTDDGATWTAANATIWDNDSTTSGLSLNALPMNTWEQQVVDLSAYAGGTVKIGFYAESTVSNADNWIYIDNVSIRTFNAQCPGVETLDAVATSGSTATINWTMNGTQSADVQVATNSSFENPVYNQTVTTSPVQLTGLTSNTTYYVRVKQTCDANETYKNASFKTFCEAVTPAGLGVEKFNDAGNLDCWTIGHTIDGSSTTNGDAKITTKSGFGKVLSMTKSANSTSYTYNDGLYAVMPELNLGADTITKYQISFDAATTSTLASNVKRLSVRVATSPTDAATWETIKDINLSSATDSTNMKSYVVTFSDYAGDYNEDYGKYICFFFQAGDSSNDVIIDNIEVERIPTCLQVAEVNAKNVRTSAATLAWTGSASQYEVILCNARSTADSAVISRQTVNADSIVISGLTAGTTYYAYVRAICGAGDTAKWSPAGMFTTCYGVPFLETFDAFSSYQNLPWTPYSATVPTDSIFDTEDLAVNASSSYKMSFQSVANTITGMAGKAARTECYSASYNGVLKSPAIDMSEIAAGTGVRLTVKLANILYFYSEPSTSEIADCSNRSLYLFVSEDGGNTFSWDNVTEWNCDGTGDFNYNEFKAAAKKYTIDLTKYDGKSIALLFATTSATSSPDSYVYIDSVAIEEYDNSCIGVSKINAKLNNTNAVVSWQKTDVSDVYYQVATDAAFANVIASDTISVDSFALSNLAYATVYYVRAKTVCGSDWAANSFKTPYGVPFEEDFNESTSYIPADWSRLTGDIYAGSASAETSYWYFESSAGGGFSTYHTYNMASTSIYTLVTPEIYLNNEAGNNLKFSFDMALTTSSSGTTAPTATVCAGRSFSVAMKQNGVWTPIAVWATDSTDTQGGYDKIPGKASNYVLDLTAYAGQNVQLGFYHTKGSSTSSSYSYINIDNVKLQSVNENCLAPVVSADDATAHSASFKWNGDAAKTYKVELSTVATFASIADSATVIGDSVVTFTNLAAATTYYAHVKTICGGGLESSWSDGVNVTTACDLYATPWTQNFESYAKGSSTADAPICWNLLNANDGTYPYIYVNNSPNYVQSGSQSLYFQSSSSRSGYAILPQFSDALNTLRIKFSCKFESTSSSGKLYVGYVTDALRENTFVSLQEVTRSISWQDVTVNFNNVPDSVANNARIAFKYANQSQNYYLGIDDITVEPIPNCNDMTGVDNVLLGTKTATFALHAADSTRLGYQYAVVKSGAALTDSTALASGLSASDTIYVSNLKAYTAYDLYARSICAAGDTSAWFVHSFKTAIGLRYEEAFTGAAIPADWKKMSGDYGSTTTTTSGWSGRSSCTAITSDHIHYNAYSSNKYWACTPAISLADVAGKNIQLSFDMALTGYNSSSAPSTVAGQSFAVVISEDGGQTYPEDNAFKWEGTEYAEIPATLTNYGLDLSAYGGKTISIAFFTRSTGGGADNDIHVANIVLDTVACQKPGGIKVLSVGGHEAEIQIKSAVEQLSYQYAYGVKPATGNFAIAPSTTIYSSDTSVISLTNLQPTTTYSIMVRSICSASDTSVWVGPFNFTTDCYNTVGYSTDFDDANSHYTLSSSYDMENCWQSNSSSSSYMPRLAENGTYDYAYSGSTALYFYAYGSSYSTPVLDAVLPLIDGDLDSLQVTFMARPGYGYNSALSSASSTDARSIKVGRMTNPAVDSTFHLLQEITMDAQAYGTALSDDPNGTNFWRSFSIPLMGAEGDYIVFRSDYPASNYFCIDDVLVERAPDCVAPMGVSANYVGTDSVGLVWNGKQGDIYEVVLVGANETLANATRRDTVVTLAASFAGLQPATTYSVYVRRTCSATAVSDWSDAYQFTTGCLEPVPAFYNFDDANEIITLADGSYMQNCWRNYTATYGTTDIDENSSYYHYSYSGTQALALYNSSTSGSKAFAIMPAFNANLDSLELSFKLRAGYMGYSSMSTYTTSSYGNVVKVGRMTNPNDPSTFTLLGSFSAPNIPSGVTETADADGFWGTAELSLAGAPGDYIAFYMGETEVSNYMWIDDVKIGAPSSCPRPKNLEISAIGTKKATATWSSSAANFNVLLITGADTASFATTDTTMTFSNLIPSTNYAVMVQAACSANESSDWTKASFSTSFGIPFTETLANGLPATWSRGTALASSVFNGGVISSASSGWTSQSATDNVPSGMGANMKVNIYGTSCKYWMLTPEIDMTDTAAYSAVRLSFDVAWTAYNSTSAPSSTSTDDKFIVAISTDGGTNWNQADAYIWANDGTGNMGLVNSIPNAATPVQIDLTQFIGQHITIGFYGESTVSVGDNDLHVANVVVNAFNESCAGVKDVTVSNIGLASADLSFSYMGGAQDAEVEVATSEAFSTIVFSTTLTGDSTVAITGLQPSKTYYVRVKQVCGAGEESAYTQAAFSTALGVPYEPSFDNGTPAGWATAKYVVTSAAQTFLTSDFSTGGAWNVVNPDTVIAATHLRNNVYGTSKADWRITPAIDLSNAVGQGLMLYVDLGLTPYSSSSAAKRNTGDDDRFMIFISEDGGLSWNQSNATVWNNDSTGATGDYSYNAIPEHAQTYRINMTKYAGKTIAIGFYAESSVSNADNYLHLGNIRLVPVSAASYTDQACAGYAYNGYGFQVPASEIATAGVYTFNSFQAAADSTQQDSITVLTLSVNGATEVENSVVVCEGEDVNAYGFQFTASLNSQAVMRHFETGSNGCDSVSILHVTVNPMLYASEADSVKKGDIYTWHGKQYDVAGSYNDTLSSQLTGCDSIVTLILTYKTQKDTTSALNDLTVFSMTAMPNPVMAGQNFTIVGDFGTGNATLRMHSLTGALIEEQKVMATGHSLPVAAPAVPGAYMISLQTQDKRLFRTKILVK